MNKNSEEYNNISGGIEAPRGSRRRFSLRGLKTFESFKTPAYRIYYAALAGQWFAMSMQMMTRSLLAYRITGSAATIGILGLAQAIPSLTVSLFGGAVADRVPKKYIIIFADFGSAVVSLIVALSLLLGYLGPDLPGSWWILVVTAMLQGTIHGFMMPARMSIIPEIVGEERVMNAISLSNMGQQVFRLVGPALAGFLIDNYGFEAIYFLMSGMFIIATLFATRLPLTSARSTRRGTALSDMIEGLRYIQRETYILLIVVFGLCHVIAGQPYMRLLPVFTEDILKVGSSGLGILTSASGAGAIICSLVLASLPNRKRGILLILSGVIMGLGVIVFSWSTLWPLSLTIIPLIQLGPTMHGALTATLIQTYTDPEFRGRMQSFVTMASGLASFGTFFAGVLSGAIGVQWSVCGMAIFLTVASFGFLIFARQLKRLE